MYHDDRDDILKVKSSNLNLDFLTERIFEF